MAQAVPKATKRYLTQVIIQHDHLARVDKKRRHPSKVASYGGGGNRRRVHNAKMLLRRLWLRRALELWQRISSGILAPHVLKSRLLTLDWHCFVGIGPHSQRINAT